MCKCTFCKREVESPPKDDELVVCKECAQEHSFEAIVIPEIRDMMTGMVDAA